MRVLIKLQVITVITHFITPVNPWTYYGRNYLRLVEKKLKENYTV